MNPFNTKAFHGTRVVPLPAVNASSCSARNLEALWREYLQRFERDAEHTNIADFRDRVRTDAIPSVPELMRVVTSGLVAWDGDTKSFYPAGKIMVVAQHVQDLLSVASRYPEPVRLSTGALFEQVGPNSFRLQLSQCAWGLPQSADHWMTNSAHWWPTLEDARKVLSVLGRATP